MTYYAQQQNNKGVESLAEVDAMLETLKNLCQIRNSKIEFLCERLSKVETPEEHRQVLEEIEIVVGLKLIYN